MAAQTSCWGGFVIAGTPLVASLDPLDELKSICKANNIWLHVEGWVSLSPYLSLPSLRLCDLLSVYCAASIWRPSCC